MDTTQAIRRKVQARLAEQRALVRSLLRLRTQLQGSLFVRYGECGKEGCACRQGRKHGPYYVFSSRSGRRSHFAYLSPRQAEAARLLVSRAREFQRGYRQLKRLNLELVRLLRRYQEAAALSESRRLRLTGEASV